MLTYPGLLGPSKKLLFYACEPLGASKTPVFLAQEPLGASQVPKIENRDSKIERQVPKIENRDLKIRVFLRNSRPRIDISRYASTLKNAAIFHTGATCGFKKSSISPTGVTWSQPGDEIENRESKIGICFWLPRCLKLTYPGKLGPSNKLLFLAREPLGTSKTPVVLVWEPLGASQVPKIKNQKSFFFGVS